MSKKVKEVIEKEKEKEMKEAIEKVKNEIPETPKETPKPKEIELSNWTKALDKKLMEQWDLVDLDTLLTTFNQFTRKEVLNRHTKLMIL